MGSVVSLLRVVAEAADALVLAAHLAAIAKTGSSRRPAGPPPNRDRSWIADIHPKALAEPMADAPMPFLGLSARGGDHVPSGLRMDLFRIGAERPNDVHHIRVRVSCCIVQDPNCFVVVPVSWTRRGSGCRPG